MPPRPSAQPQKPTTESDTEPYMAASGDAVVNALEEPDRGGSWVPGPTLDYLAPVAWIPAPGDLCPVGPGVAMTSPGASLRSEVADPGGNGSGARSPDRGAHEVGPKIWSMASRR
jgi:hypothetical protein